ncbi:MAG: NAD(P)-dependent oxidoreductase, partial [Anaerolineales bacterium]
MIQTLGFIGLGIMGLSMAGNLLKASFPVRVWNRSASKMDALAAEGATTASSPAELAAQCDVIFICVSDTPDVQAVVLGENGVIHGAKPGALVVDMSTISPAATREMAAALAAKGVSMLDAPVSGGSEGAAKGALTIMVGGKADDVERALPYFK